MFVNQLELLIVRQFDSIDIVNSHVLSKLSNQKDSKVQTLAELFGPPTTPNQLRYFYIFHIRLRLPPHWE